LGGSQRARLPRVPSGAGSWNLPVAVRRRDGTPPGRATETDPRLRLGSEVDLRGRVLARPPCRGRQSRRGRSNTYGEERSAKRRYGLSRRAGSGPGLPRRLCRPRHGGQAGTRGGPQLVPRPKTKSWVGPLAATGAHAAVDGERHTVDV